MAFSPHTGCGGLFSVPTLTDGHRTKVSSTCSVRRSLQGLYTTKDFERVVSLLTRTEAAAKHLTEYLRRTDRWAKTIVFCVDQEHADQMRRALHNANSDLTRQHPNYVVRIVSDEGEIGRGTSATSPIPKSDSR